LPGLPALGELDDADDAAVLAELATLEVALETGPPAAVTPDVERLPLLADAVPLMTVTPVAVPDVEVLVVTAPPERVVTEYELVSEAVLDVTPAVSRVVTELLVPAEVVLWASAVVALSATASALVRVLVFIVQYLSNSLVDGFVVGCRRVDCLSLRAGRGQKMNE